ncbi:MAG: aminoacyl-tRNA deacylase [Acidobacteria bacterium]|nr:MAG: aminoacyl-tRNA deacylase [Acidobacteriota bacterium]REK04195.1 MAG: aminoacyl-tRNA deacylase [Acidobacteriota bacterium]REK15357.1 MAG: aminoacyl-tRNA deacylase [Acidobacteriota bacterium]REK46447.1 MAG: aminoacyl-tRNA deacylase [Acidobacteriota bacterium]
MPAVQSMKVPVTQAVRFLRANKIEFVPHLFEYVEKGGASHSAEVLGLDEHSVIKTLIFETTEGDPVAVLMHGGKEVSEKNLARHLGVKSVSPASQQNAQKWTGYIFGGTSPFGMKREMPVFAESTIFGLEKIWINGGKRGFLVEIEPSDLKRSLEVIEVELAI